MPKTDHRKNLTPTLIKGLKPAPEGERYQVMDAVVPGLGVRITDRGTKTFIMKTRFPGYANPARREIGSCLTMTLADARQKARRWRELIDQALDPAVEEERARKEAARQRAITFGAVAKDFIAQKLPGERKGKDVEREIMRDLMPRWENRPIASINDLDVLVIIKAKIPDGKVGARNLLALVKRFFLWVVAQREYGLAISPCVMLRTSAIFGDDLPGPRDRILTDDEIFAYWRATTRMPNPHRAVYQVLMLTALRLNEVAEASWSEFDIRNRLWVVPAGRMKGKNAGKKQARPHAVPLTEEAILILEGLPRFRGGAYAFSTTHGTTAVWMGTKPKERLERRMLRTLRALARVRREDHRSVELPHFVNHDVRRTVRSQLSRLRVAEEVAEAVLAHARPGIKKVYDQHDYIEEKREALERWASRLKHIVNSEPSNVVQFRATA